MWRDSICVYQRAVKAAKSKYLSVLVTTYTDLRFSSLLSILCLALLSTFFLMLPYDCVNNFVHSLMRKPFN